MYVNNVSDYFLLSKCKNNAEAAAPFHRSKETNKYQALRVIFGMIFLVAAYVAFTYATLPVLVVAGVVMALMATLMLPVVGNFFIERAVMRQYRRDFRPDAADRLARLSLHMREYMEKTYSIDFVNDNNFMTFVMDSFKPFVARDVTDPYRPYQMYQMVSTGYSAYALMTLGVPTEQQYANLPIQHNYDLSRG